VSEWLWWLLLLGGGLLGGALALLLGTSRRRVAMLLALGVILGAAYVLAAYLSAPIDARDSNCSDCTYYGGRYWEPGLVFVILIWNLIAWTAAVLVASSIRAWLGRRRAAAGEVAWR
jgi:heme/copper-type cytochrome/quinol oxidase subunit 3